MAHPLSSVCNPPIPLGSSRIPWIVRAPHKKILVLTSAFWLQSLGRSNPPWKVSNVNLTFFTSHWGAQPLLQNPFMVDCHDSSNGEPFSCKRSGKGDTATCSNGKGTVAVTKREWHAVVASVSWGFKLFSIDFPTIVNEFKNIIEICNILLRL